MYLNEPNAALRTIVTFPGLRDIIGSYLPSNHVFAANDLILIKPSGIVVDMSALVMPVVGTIIGGRFKFVIPQPLLDEVGMYTFELHGAAYSDWEWGETVDVDTRPALNTLQKAAPILVAELTTNVCLSK